MTLLVAFLLHTQSAHAGSSATKMQKCINRQIFDTLQTEEGRVDVRMVGSYFDGIHKNIFRTCFVLHKGDAFEILDERRICGKQMYKIRDLHSDIYQWIPRERMTYVEGTTMKVKDSFFQKAHGFRLDTCFELKRSKYYPVTAAKSIQGKFMIEIQDPDSELLQWLPYDLIEVKDPVMIKKCGGVPPKS